MFSLAVLALASIASSANALVIPRSTPPPSYAVGYLEDYTTYHIRYLALNCNSQHDTQFFDDCCHPMLATENLKDNRKASCTPSASASSSASVAEPTSTVVPSGDDDCSDDDEESSAADPAPTSAAAPAPANAAPAPSADSSSEAPKASSSSEKPKPSPSPSPTESAAPAPKPTDNGNGGGIGGIVGQLFKGGIATFFFQNGVAGNCGTVHSDSDKVVALESSTYAGGSHCGKKIQIKDTKTGHTAVGTVADSCPTCNNPQSIDLSQALFDEFATAADGIFNVEWGFME